MVNRISPRRGASRYSFIRPLASSRETNTVEAFENASGKTLVPRGTDGEGRRGGDSSIIDSVLGSPASFPIHLIYFPYVDLYFSRLPRLSTNNREGGHGSCKLDQPIQVSRVLLSFSSPPLFSLFFKEQGNFGN